MNRARADLTWGVYALCFFAITAIEFVMAFHRIDTQTVMAILMSINAALMVFLGVICSIKWHKIRSGA